MSDRRISLQRLEETKVVIVVRGSQATDLCRMAMSLRQTGLDIIEITMTTPGALRSIRELRAKCPDVLVGAGTVLSRKMAEDVIRAGAQFVVSPILDQEVIRVSHDHDVMAIPGTLSPSEAFAAWEAGADVVKVFPASIGGPDYIRAIRGPLPNLKLLPTGGVSVSTSIEYLKAGAVAVCLGTALVDHHALTTGDYSDVLSQAQGLVEQIRALA